MDRDKEDKFVESWGSMGMLWGVNRSIARIHAFLIISDSPKSLDDIASRLQVSRGNTSMSLRELRTWGVVKLIKIPGDRRDFYESEPDVWKMFFLILGERKRREFDPALEAVRVALQETSQSSDNTKKTSSAVQQRLFQMEELMGTMERVMTTLLANETTSRRMLKFLADRSS